MSMKRNKISQVIPLLNKMMEGESLTPEETRRAFATIIREEKDSYFLAAFFAILSTKGETADELYGLCQALSEFCPKPKMRIDPNNITDLSGTGGAKLKTINVSTAASFVVASAGPKVAKQAFPGISSPTGSADMFRAFGIDVLSLDINQIRKCLTNVGISPYNVVFSIATGLENIKNFGRLQFEKGLAIRTPMHLMSNIFSPIEMRRRIYGMFTGKYLSIVAELLQKLGYVKGMVFHGLDGLCEISNIGLTKIVEFNETERKEYTVGPEDFGIRKAIYEEIKPISPEQNVIDFVRILFGKEKGAKRDIVLLNAAASLYVMEKAKDIKEGIQIAKNLIEEGKAWGKVENLVSSIGEPEKLADWKEKAGI